MNFAIALLTMWSSCENRYMNFKLTSGIFANPGRILLIVCNRSSLFSYRGHTRIKCSSFSIVLGHTLQYLSFLGILGLFLLPSSIINGWSDTRSFVNATLYFLFLIWYRYGSFFGNILKLLYVSHFGELSKALFHASSKMCLVIFLILWFGVVNIDSCVSSSLNVFA